MIDWENRCTDNSSEEAHQICLFGWSAENVGKYPELQWLFAIPNGGYRAKGEAGRLKAAGVKAGVPDICLSVAKSLHSFDYYGAFFELKLPIYKTRKNGGCSDEQLKWIAQLEQSGYFVAVCYGWKDAREQILKYLEYIK